MTVEEMYAKLTPENRRKVDAKIEELLEQQDRKGGKENG